MNVVLRHAAASQAQITLHLGDETARLTIEDDGKGFDFVELGPSTQEHLGLHGMQERLELVGGQLSFESSTQTGTKLIAVVPKHYRILPERVA